MHYAFYVEVSGSDARVTDAEVPGDGGVDTGRVENLALDGASLHHIGGERSEGSLLPEVGSQGLHAAQEVSLEVADPA